LSYGRDASWDTYDINIRDRIKLKIKIKLK